jgi:nucleotide-binding universal stress UspA family protein
MERIVVGTDGSVGADAAVRWAAALAAVHGAELVVMTGYQPTVSELPPDRVDRDLRELEQNLERWAAPARTAGVPVRTVVDRSDPRDSIVRVAEETGADMLVVGRVGTSGGPGVLRLSSTAEYLAHNLDRSFGVVGGEAQPGFRRILLGMDGSEHGRAAVRWAAETARRAGADVVAATVWQPSAALESGLGARRWQRWVAEQMHESWALPLAEAGVPYEVQALRGSNPADALLRAARRGGADTIVVGMRGLGGFTGLRFGRTALRVLHKADRPVVLVPPDDVDADDGASGGDRGALNPPG